MKASTWQWLILSVVELLLLMWLLPQDLTLLSTVVIFVAVSFVARVALLKLLPERP